MTITVLLADDNLIVREGVKSLLELEDDLDVVGQGADYDELVAGADATHPQVIVTDIRMPPNFSVRSTSRVDPGRWPTRRGGAGTTSADRS